jgi:hypothetical protein
MAPINKIFCGSQDEMHYLCLQAELKQLKNCMQRDMLQTGSFNCQNDTDGKAVVQKCCATEISLNIRNNR